MDDGDLTTSFSRRRNSFRNDWNNFGSQALWNADDIQRVAHLSVE